MKGIQAGTATRSQETKLEDRSIDDPNEPHFLGVLTTYVAPALTSDLAEVILLKMQD